MVEKPEQLMSLTQYIDAWQRALDRQKEREEMLEADDVEESGDVSEDQFEEKDVEMEVGEETSDQMEEKTNVQNGQNGFDASEKFFALCKGFTDEDCDVEEYFEENHENVEQVWRILFVKLGCCAHHNALRCGREVKVKAVRSTSGSRTRQLSKDFSPSTM